MGGIEVVDARLRELYERAVDVLGADDRVIEVKAGGSIASGTADEWSDLDLQVVVDPARHDEFLAAWPEWVAAITPTVFAKTPLAPFIINTVTADGLTLDIAVYSGAVYDFPPAQGWAVGMLANRRFATLAEALDYAVDEQLRGMAGPFVSLVQRDEHMKHLTGVPHILGLLTTVFLAETGRDMPGKIWNRTFTEEQQAAVASLPPVSATRDGIIDFGVALARMVLERARPLYPQYGLTWPSDLAAVVAERVHDQLGIDVSAWCY